MVDELVQRLVTFLMGRKARDRHIGTYFPTPRLDVEAVGSNKPAGREPRSVGRSRFRLARHAMSGNFVSSAARGHRSHHDRKERGGHVR